MSGEARSLSVLAAVANEQRTALAYNNAMAMPMVQRTIPLARGTMPLLARMLTQNQKPLQSFPSNGRLSPTSRPASNSASQSASTGPNAAKATSPVDKTPAKPTPQKFLKDLFAELDIGESTVPKRFSRGDFVKPDDDECKDYNEAANFVRTNNLEKIRSLHEEGKNLDACNRVGESLLHLACRRGHVEMAEYLLNEAKVRWDLQDDFGRSILHDALWRPSPSIELMEVILKVVSPEWLMSLDIRGHTPFDYARREHSTVWYDFLKEREDLLRRRLSLLM